MHNIIWIRLTGDLFNVVLFLRQYSRYYKIIKNFFHMYTCRFVECVLKNGFVLV